MAGKLNSDITTVIRTPKGFSLNLVEQPIYDVKGDFADTVHRMKIILMGVFCMIQTEASLLIR